MLERHRASLLITLALLAFAIACEGGSSGPTATPDATPTPGARPLATLAPTGGIVFEPAVHLYGAEPDDKATALATGDFNGDGILDIVLAAAFADGPENARPDAGEAYLFLGPFVEGETRDTAIGEQDVTIFGAASGDQLGRALTTADLNGDGTDDLVLGAPFADTRGADTPDTGAAYVLLGRDPWPARFDLAADAPDIAVLGGDAEDLAGFSLTAGDFNDDTIDDLLVGAFWADGPDNQRPDAGEAYVILGSPSPATLVDLAAGDQDATAYGAGAGDQLAETVAAGDVNGDGTADLVLAATFASGPEDSRNRAGEVYVLLGGDLHGKYDFAESVADFTVIGADEGDQIGHSAATGDFNGDAVGDLVLGAVSADGPENDVDLAGEAYIIYLAGRPPGDVIDAASEGGLLVAYGRDLGDRLGRAVAAGQLDGHPFILLAAPGGDGPDNSLEDAGEIHVLLARPRVTGTLHLDSEAADATVLGEDAGDSIATGVHGRPALLAADVNGDGLDDVLVTGLGDGPDGDRRDAGEALVLFARR